MRLLTEGLLVRAQLGELKEKSDTEVRNHDCIAFLLPENKNRKIIFKIVTFSEAGLYYW